MIKNGIYLMVFAIATISCKEIKTIDTVQTEKSVSKTVDEREIILQKILDLPKLQ